MRLASMMFLSLAALLQGCATQASSKTEFTPSSDTALVVMGVKSNVGPYGLTFGRLDPETCQLNPLDFGKAFDHKSPWSPTAWKASERHYVMATFEPGTWIISNMSFEDGITRNVQYVSGTLAFTARAGEFIYLGDIEFEKRGFRFKGHNHEPLKAHLSNYPDVSVPPTDHPRWITPFAEGGPVADCNTKRY